MSLNCTNAQDESCREAVWSVLSDEQKLALVEMTSGSAQGSLVLQANH